MINMEELKELATASAGSASALPYWAYTSEEVYEQERQKIFHKDWVFVCNEFMLPKPGDRYALILAGEPVVVLRGKDGKLRAMSNTCRHRGTLLADEGFSDGTANLVCPYHGWNYTDEGKLRGLPFSGNVKVDKQKHCLPVFAIEVWHGLVFVNIDGSAEPLSERYAHLEPYMTSHGQGTYNSGYEDESDYWASNWKLAMENAMESYHLFKVHQPTLETVTPTKGAFYVEGGAEATVTAGEVTSTGSRMGDWLYGNSAKDLGHYILISLPPSFVGIIDSDGVLGYIAVLPEGPGRTYARGGAIGVNMGKPKGTQQKFVQDFFAEDKWICERAYKGMTTRVAPGGQLVELERVVVDFHQYIANRLFGHKPDDYYVEEKGVKRLEATE